MTITNENSSKIDFMQEVEALRAEVERDPTDLAAKISLASLLEQAGVLSEARKIYQELVEADPAGVFGNTASKAIEAISVSNPETLFETVVLEEEGSSAVPTTPSFSQPSVTPQHTLRTSAAPQKASKKSPLQWFYNLPIARKQLTVLLASQFISVLGLMGVSTTLIVSGLRTHLVQQAESELAVMQLAYDIKTNQMGFGFRGQAENTAIIEAAQAEQPSSEQLSRVQSILVNEINNRQIEYATLVGPDLRIIVNANANRQGEVFNPNNLVKKVFEQPSQLNATETVSWEELKRENPPLPSGFGNEDALIRYTVTPVFDPITKEVLAALVSGDIVNYKLPIVAEVNQVVEGGYSAVYQRQPSGEFILATSQEKVDKTKRARVALPNTDLLKLTVNAKGEVVTERVKLGSQTYTMAAKVVPNGTGVPTAVLVRGTPETDLNILLSETLWVQLILSLVILAVVVLLAVLMGRKITGALVKLRESALTFAQGDRSARAEVLALDEVGQLAITFNQMADSVNASANALEEQVRQRQAEAEFHRETNKRLQQEVINLLLEIEGAQRGDLTVRAIVVESEMGSIADAFNATISNLQQIVTQVRAHANQVHLAAFDSKAGVQKLATEASTQASEVAQALKTVEEMGQSIESVAASATEAAAIARLALDAATEGGQTMDQTVGSIENIRNSVAQTTKKAKRLAESSQEISKIVGIISGISEKTNLLAFNASIEAARAGEHGQGFRVVADEVRRLAERVTNFAKEIEQIVNTIQQETAEVLHTMEASTTHVVTGTQLVGKTKQTLTRLAGISQQIDAVLQSISTSTVSQAQASQTVNQTIQEVAAIAASSSSESEVVSESLQQMVDAAQGLQNSVSRFRVKK